MPKFKKIHMIYDERCQLHLPPPDHPEGPERTLAIKRWIEGGILSDVTTFVPARKATIDELCLVHSRDYVMRFEEACLSGQSYLGARENAICYDTFEAALVAAGGALMGVELLAEGEAGVVFCCVRPPGHHAERAMALGFCFLNNCALAAKYMQSRYGVGRVAIVDFDAHHGNGIESVFLEDPSVLYISVHEHPMLSFPGTGYSEDRGEGRGEGFTLNIPLTSGGGEKEVMEALKMEIGPAIQEFTPDALVIAAGFDAHEMDDLSGLAYPTKLFGNLGIACRLWAEEFCGGRVLAILEGGYHLEALPASCERFLGGLSLITP